METPHRGEKLFAEATDSRGRWKQYNDRIWEVWNMGMDYLALDIETTGLSPEKNRIIEIGAVKYRNGQAAGEFSCLVKICQPLPAKITELTGITEEMLSHGQDERTAVTEFLAFAKDDPILLGHNIGFDYSFLKVAALRFPFV